MDTVVTFTPSARYVYYDGGNKDFITTQVGMMFGGTVNDQMAGQDGALLVVLPGGATHVLLPRHFVVEFLGELKIIPFNRMRIVS